jgi:diguanylate cyclase (GGDEF)-like protein
VSSDDSEVPGILKTVEQLAAFNDTAKALMSTLEVRPLLVTLSQIIMGLLGPHTWSLLLWDERTNRLRVEIAGGDGAAQVTGLELKSGEGLASQVFSTGVAQREQPAGSDPLSVVRYGPNPPPRSLTVIPLTTRGVTCGVLELITAAHELSDDHFGTVLGIAELAATAIENARNFERVRNLTTIDEHTGLFNSRHLSAEIEREVERARRFQHPLSLLFLDLDHFKQVNDTHGHMSGSALLRELGALLRETIRRLDSAYRYGGDEFAVLLIETDLPGATMLAERIRTRVREHVFLKEHGLAIRLTTSIGVASLHHHAINGAGLLAAGDAAMYQAKRRRDSVAAAVALAAAG